MDHEAPDEAPDEGSARVKRIAMASLISGSSQTSVAERVLETVLWPRDRRGGVEWTTIRLRRQELQQIAISAVFLAPDLVVHQAWEAALREMARIRAAKEQSVVARLRQPRPQERFYVVEEDDPPASA